MNLVGSRLGNQVDRRAAVFAKHGGEGLRLNLEFLNRVR